VTIPDRLAIAISAMIAARGVTPCVSVYVTGVRWAALLCDGEIHVATGDTLTPADLLAAPVLDLDTLPARQRRPIEAAVASLSARTRDARGRVVAVLEA